MPPQQTQQEVALFKAAQAGKLDDVLQIAEELGRDIKTIADANGANCLHVAAYAGQTALCKHLVEELQFDINSQDGGGALPAVFHLGIVLAPTCMAAAAAATTAACCLATCTADLCAGCCN